MEIKDNQKFKLCSIETSKEDALKFLSIKKIYKDKPYFWNNQDRQIIYDSYLKYDGDYEMIKTHIDEKVRKE